MIEIINIIRTLPMEVIYVAGAVYLFKTKEINNFILKLFRKKPERIVVINKKSNETSVVKRKK